MSAANRFDSIGRLEQMVRGEECIGVVTYDRNDFPILIDCAPGLVADIKQMTGGEIPVRANNAFPFATKPVTDEENR